MGSMKHILTVLWYPRCLLQEPLSVLKHLNVNMFYSIWIHCSYNVPSKQIPSDSSFSKYSRTGLPPTLFSGKRQWNTLIWEINLKQELINSEFWGYGLVNFKNKGDAWDQPSRESPVNQTLRKQENRTCNIKEDKKNRDKM